MNSSKKSKWRGRQRHTVEKNSELRVVAYFGNIQSLKRQSSKGRRKLWLVHKVEPLASGQRKHLNLLSVVINVYMPSCLTSSLAYLSM